MKYIYDATGRKLTQNVYQGTSTLKKTTDYGGEFIYENDTLQFINTEEGRIVMTGAEPEYQYHLKDHLGNVRLTFTATPEHEVDTATLEDSHLAEDASKFLRVSSAKRINAAIFDHTNGSSTGYSQRLNGSTDEKFGLARSISVMPGDTVKAEVWAKYVDPDDNNWDGLFETLLGQIAANASGVVYTGENYTSNTAPFPFPTTQATTDNENAPKAYLNWLVFDRNYTFIAAKSGYQQLSTAAKEAGADVAHEHLSSPSIAITEPGYVYIYLSNEETTPVEVYFDDLKVTHTQSSVVQSDDYYPFGLSISALSYQRENSLLNRYQYNQGIGENIFRTERVFDLDLNVDQSKYRTYDYVTGKWWQIDPKADTLYSLSPYNYANGNPVRLNDPKGDCPPVICGAVAGAIIGAVAGTVVAVIDGQDLEGVLIGAAGGAVSVAIIGSGVGLLSSTALGGSIAGVASTNAATGFVAGAAESLTTQGLQVATGQQEEINTADVVRSAAVSSAANVIAGPIANKVTKKVGEAVAKVAPPRAVVATQAVTEVVLESATNKAGDATKDAMKKEKPVEKKDPLK